MREVASASPPSTVLVAACLTLLGFVKTHQSGMVLETCVVHSRVGDNGSRPLPGRKPEPLHNVPREQQCACGTRQRNPAVWTAPVLNVTLRASQRQWGNCVRVWCTRQIHHTSGVKVKRPNFLFLVRVFGCELRMWVCRGELKLHTGGCFFPKFQPSTC